MMPDPSKSANISASIDAEPAGVAIVGADAPLMGGAGYTPSETGGEVTSPWLTEGGKTLETDKVTAVPLVGEIRYAPPSGRNGNRLPLGAHPLNTGGKKGRSGRISTKLGLFLKELRESEDFHEVLRKVAMNPRSRNFPTVLKLLQAYDTERPADRRETSGTQEVTVRFEREGRRITAR